MGFVENSLLRHEHINQNNRAKQNKIKRNEYSRSNDQTLSFH